MALLTTRVLARLSATLFVVANPALAAEQALLTPLSTPASGETAPLQYEKVKDDTKLPRIIDQAGQRDWVNDMLVIVGMKGMPDEGVDYQRIINKIDPDFNDWSGPPFIEEFLPFGIRSSESVNKFSKTWPDEELNQQFAEAVCRTVTGRKATSTTMRGTKQTMCHNDPAWHQFKKDDILDNLGRAKNRPPVGGINQDLLNVIRPEPGFCEDDQREFRTYLRKHYNPQELRSMGVGNLDTFDFCKYLEERELGNALVEDPLVRNYILALNLSQLAAWEDIVSAAHDLEKSLGRGIFMTGNQHPGEVVYGNMLSRVNDIVSDEKDSWFDEYAYPRRGSISILAKLSRATGDYEKPVWFRGGLYDRNRVTPDGRAYRMRLYGEVFQDLVHGEAFANGCVRVFDLANEASPAPEPPYEHREPFFNRFADYTRLINAHRAVFQDRENAAEVGLVYSISTQLWESFDPLKIRIKNHYERFLGWGRALEEMHCPYQVVMFGHPETFPDNNLQERLSRYRVLVVPGVESLTDEQGRALRSFVEGGGILVYSGNLAIYDENRFKRTKPLFDDFPRLMRDAVGKGKVVGLYDNDQRYFSRVSEGEPPQAVDFHAMREAVMWGLEGQPQVESNAPREVQFNLWLADNHRSASLHLVNYKLDLMGDYAEPVRNFDVSVKLPAGLDVPDRVTWLRPGQADCELAFNIDHDGQLLVRIPELRVWGILVFSQDKEQEAASALAMVRKQLRKQVVLGKSDLEPLMDAYARAHEHYLNKDYQLALDRAADLFTFVPDP